MKLLKKIKGSDGTMEFKLLVESVEDLWHLYNLLTIGDSITCKSRRKVHHENAVSQLGNTIKMIVVEIAITDINFSPDEIRINGTNKTQSEFLRIGAYHSIIVSCDPPQAVVIKKNEWNEILEERLRDCCLPASSSTALILMNYGEGKVAMLHSSIIEIKAHLKKTIAKKHCADGMARDKSILRFFQQVKDAIVRFVDFEATKVVILASPGNVRNEFFSFLQTTTQHDHPSERALARFLPKFTLVKVHDLSHEGIRQVLEDPVVGAAVQSRKYKGEMDQWKRFQAMLSKHPDRCVYTPQLAFHAVNLGAVSSLMINDKVFRSPDPVERCFFLALAQCVRRIGGSKVTAFSSNHVIGEQLSMLGDVAAVLSYDCPELNDIVPEENFISSKQVAEFLEKEKIMKVTL